jgi:hypothetical protein
MAYNSLANYYNMFFQLRHYHKYSDSDMLNWLPFERDIYVDLLLAALDKEKLEAEQRNK